MRVGAAGGRLLVGLAVGVRVAGGNDLPLTGPGGVHCGGQRVGQSLNPRGEVGVRDDLVGAVLAEAEGGGVRAVRGGRGWIRTSVGG